MELINFIREETYILVPVLYILGMFLKATPPIRDWTIPHILLGIGIVFSTSLMGFSVDAIIQGILVTGGAVLVYQLGKQARYRHL